MSVPPRKFSLGTALTGRCRLGERCEVIEGEIQFEDVHARLAEEDELPRHRIFGHQTAHLRFGDLARTARPARVVTPHW